MSYLVLARKYRPQTFADVTGQEIVTRTLQGAIQEGRVAHAYLLCGPRGTGKTTTARLFAKALNCENGPTIDPCGTCPRCKAAEAGNEPDLIEIDAASNTGVDNVRDLRDQAAYAPLQARHKIYIIDEAHMLSKAAFNALLKTLEEPPPHVKFLFATTEPHKLPDTITSRCQVLKLSMLSEEKIEGRLAEVFGHEGVQAEAGVCAAIARRARGGMRDALSLADQLLALVGDKPTLADTERLAAGADRDTIESIVRAMTACDRAALLGLLQGNAGGERELLDSVLLYLRGCLLCAHCGADNPLTDAPTESRAGMAELAKTLGGERIELMMEDLLHARDQMRVLPSAAPLILELSLLQLARPASSMPIAELAGRLLRLEQRLEQGGASAAGAWESSGPERGTATPQPPVDLRQETVPRPGPDDSQASATPRTATQPIPTQPAATPPMPARAAAPQSTVTQPGPQSSAPTPARRQRPQFAGAVHSSKVEAWKRFLEDVGDKAPALSNVLAQYGKLLELNGGRATIRFEKMREADRPLIMDARNQRLCSKVFSDLMQESVTVLFEDGERVTPGESDAFTAQVRKTFNGRIEG